MKLGFRASFTKDLGRVQNKWLYKRIRGIIHAVETATTISAIKDIKRLKANGFYYRIRVGDYRIGLVLEEEKIVFVRCLHRRDIYRYFP